jgi:hypothetical protein
MPVSPYISNYSIKLKTRKYFFDFQLNQFTTTNEKEPLLPNISTDYSSTSCRIDPEQEEGNQSQSAPGSTTDEQNLEPKKSFSWLGYVFCVFSGLCFIAW